MSLAVVVKAQNGAYQQGLSLHNQQIQEHLRKEQEQQRQVNLFGGSFPQQQQYNSQPSPQYNQYNDNNNYARSSNTEEQYQIGLREHQKQINKVLAKEASLHPQHAGNPAYQQGLEAHRLQIQVKRLNLCAYAKSYMNLIMHFQEHLKQEQQHGGPAVYQSPQQSYHQPAPQAYNNNNNFGHNAGLPSNLPGLQAHQQQLLEHQRQEQSQQAQVGAATQYHHAHQQQFPQPQRSYYQEPQPQQQNSYQPQYSNPNLQRDGKISLADLGF